MRKFVFLLLLSISGFLGLDAQSYGYCNGGNLMEALALKEKTDDALTAFQAPLIAQGQDKVLAIKEKEKKLYEDIEQGILSQIAIQKRQDELIKESEALQKFETDVTDKISKKRQELLTPLLEKIQKAIDEVAKARGYKMVFDESLVSAVLFADKSLDITDEVKAKLGL